MSIDTRTCDIAIIGGGLGGVAAALSACAAGASVVLTESTDWLGGQMTSQGTSALDEHPYIETFGGTRTYYELRERIRSHYRARFGIERMPNGAPLNPGNGWVSNLCFEPIVGAHALEAMLAAHIESGRLTILYGVELIAAEVEQDTIRSVTLAAGTNSEITVVANMFLDATDLGDLLPLVGAEYVTGAEAFDDTAEPFAPAGPPRPTEVQGFTFPFAVEYCPGEDHTIPKPAGYEYFCATQPYTLTLAHRSGPPRPFRVFEHSPTGLPPFWTYRRLLDGSLDSSGQARDIAMINWPGNDYHHGDILGADHPERAHLLHEARNLSLGFLYWLQTECPRDDGSGFGYPGMRLLPEVMGTADGLSKAPYIRESRRIVARTRILATDILDVGQDSARAINHRDSVGIGWYHMDVHPANGNPIDRYEPTKPFQIPLGALIPQRVRNLLAACKNIGTTHLSNGAYRLHPVEWNIGESAGILAAMCCAENLDPAQVHADSRRRMRLQSLLLKRGIPLAWTLDVPYDHPLFELTQHLCVAGAIVSEGPRSRSLNILPDERLMSVELEAVRVAADQFDLHLPADQNEYLTWAAVCQLLQSNV